jgi:hypothetical protein
LRSFRLLRRTLLPAAVVAAVAATLAAPDAGAVPTFGSPVVVTSKDVSEPGIDIAADGTIYVNGPGGIAVNSGGPGPSFLFRSTNAGASFTETSNLTRLDGPGGGDSDLVVTPEGRLAWTDLWVGSSSVACDPIDKGDTWITNPVQGVVAQDRQWLAATPGAVYHLTHQLEGGLVVSKSFDCGATYQVHNLAVSVAAQGYCLCYPGNIIAEAGAGPLGNGVAGTLTDKVGLIFPTAGGLGSTTQGISFAKSVDGGVTWTQHTIVAPAAKNRRGVFPVVANGGGGNLYAVWYEDGKIAFAKSTTWGDSWSGVTYVSGSDSALMPWVAANGSKVAIAYYGKTGSDWFVRYTESTDSGVTFSSPVSADSTKVKHNTPCIAGTACNGDRELGDFLQVALDANNKANIVYVHSYESQTLLGVFGTGLLFNNTEVRYVKQS